MHPQNNNNERRMEPKVFALILEAEALGAAYLSIQYAYSLEEAFALAKIEFEKQNPLRMGINNPLIGSKIGLFTIKTLKELTNTKMPMPVATRYEKAFIPTPSPAAAPTAPVVPKDVDKNKLMQVIVATNDKELFEKNKTLFSETERKYLKAHLK